MEPGGIEFFDLRPLDHATITNESHSFGPEPRRGLVQLRREGLDVGGVPGEDFDRQWPSVTIAQQPDDDLALALFTVAVVAKGGKGVLGAFQIAAGDIVKKRLN